jgi:hypothetical protein
VALDWVKELDFDTCERLDKSFISDHYKETASDIIYKIRLKQKEIYIVILVEFKSKVERFTSLSILNYIRIITSSNAFMRTNRRHNKC